MEKEDIIFKLYQPVISGSSYGVLNIEDNNNLTISVSIKQLEERIVGNKIRKLWRHGSISGDIKPMLEMEFYDGMHLPGKIKVTETFYPVIPDEPELYIKKNSDGSICRVNGKVVYRTESYTPDPFEQDIIIC